MTHTPLYILINTSPSSSQIGLLPSASLSFVPSHDHESKLQSVVGRLVLDPDLVLEFRFLLRCRRDYWNGSVTIGCAKALQTHSLQIPYTHCCSCCGFGYDFGKSMLGCGSLPHLHLLSVFPVVPAPSYMVLVFSSLGFSRLDRQFLGCPRR